jgi:tRNA-binding EMAP/Myf-like protein
VRTLKVLGSELILLSGKLLLALSDACLLGLSGLVAADGSQEWLEVEVKILWVDAKVPVEEEEKLLLHEVDLGDGEAKVLVAADSTVPGPVLVLGRGVVEVLCSEDEGSQEDSVDGASHALGDRRET